MTENEREEFAKLIIHHVRDMAIKSCDTQLHTKNLNSPTAKRWNEALKEGDPIKFAEMIIADSIDDAIFYFLLAIDDELINVSFKSASGDNLAFTSDNYLGELGGWYSGEWRMKYSNERSFNDFED